MAITTVVGLTDTKITGYNKSTKTVEQHLSFDEAEKLLSKEKAEREKEEKDAKKSPYTAFVQLNKNPYLMLISKNNQTASLILNFFLWKMDRMNEITVKRSVLAEALDISEATIDRGLKYLKDTKCIEVIKEDCINTYIVNPYIAWYNYGNRIQNCRFKALGPPKLENKCKNINRLYFSKGILRLKKLKKQTKSS